VGWVFEDAPEIEEAGFLGADRALCTDEDLVLDAYSFSPNEIYLWSDGTTDSVITVGTPGIYFVEVQFESSCILRDTIEIFTAQDIMAELPPVLSACEGELLVLDAEVAISTAHYAWNDGSTNATLNVTSSGTYTVDIDVDGCISSATSEITIVEDPGVDLGADQSFCEGSSFVIVSPISSDNFLWQDGSMSSDISSDTAGLYWLEISLNNCAFRDSVEIQFVPLPTVELGNDTMVCDNETFFLSIDNPDDFQVTWQDGSSLNMIEVTEAGNYLATVDDNGCVNEDSVFISFIAAPEVDLGLDIQKCEGDIHLLNVPDPSLIFTWNTGSQEAELEVETSGTYSLEVEENGCLGRDSINITFEVNPRVDLGPDTTVCNDMPYVLSAVTNAGDIFWEDGSMGSTLTVEESGEIKVEVSENGCSAVDSVQINFRDCISFEAFIPNAFSPNEDGFNDLFEVYFAEGLIIESYSMKIYDRWGNSVFTSETYGDFWDGKRQSSELDRGVYTYFLELSYIDDFGSNDASISGDICILE